MCTEQSSLADMDQQERHDTATPSGLLRVKSDNGTELHVIRMQSVECVNVSGPNLFDDSLGDADEY